MPPASFCFMPRFAAIDVGSNALRLRVDRGRGPVACDAGRSAAAARPDGADTWRDLATLRAPVRLGAEVFLSGRLAPASIGQACDALREFRAGDGPREGGRLPRHRHERRARGEERRDPRRARAPRGRTSSSRRSRASRRRGSSSSRSRGACRSTSERALLVDVGGGSTELTLLDRGETGFTMSLPLGTVRILEAYLKGVKTVDRAARAAARGGHRPRARRGAAAARQGRRRSSAPAATSTRSASCARPRERAASTCAAAKALFKKMCAMSNGERRDAYQLRPDRADTIVPATAIFLRLAHEARACRPSSPRAWASPPGILEELVDKFFHVWDAAGEAERVLDACARLGPALPLRRGPRAARHALRRAALRRPARACTPSASATGCCSAPPRCCTTSATTSTTAATTSTATT